MIFSGLTSLLLGEMCLGYYVIYEVSWLGWDLVEPLTYTIGQFYFLCSIYFYSKTKRAEGYTSLWNYLNSHYREKVYKKKRFEYMRLGYMKNQLEEVSKKIEELERRKNF